MMSAVSAQVVRISQAVSTQSVKCTAQLASVLHTSMMHSHKYQYTIFDMINHVMDQSPIRMMTLFLSPYRYDELLEYETG